MKTKVFIVCGYGIPRNIFEDENYISYLSAVFKEVDSFSTQETLTIIFCGGKTDMFPPYKRTEAEEMIRLFKSFAEKKDISNWKIIAEKGSLSTLENLINSKDILIENKIGDAEIFIFCEQSRREKVEIIANEVFDELSNIKIISIDFNISTNKKAPPELLAKKEKIDLEYSLWSMQSQENLKKHHEIFVEKIDFLRKAGPERQAEALADWWKEKLDQSEERKDND